MMWGAMRYGYKLISLLWAVVLMISIHSYQKLHSHLSRLYHAAGHNLLQLSGILFYCQLYGCTGNPSESGSQTHSAALRMWTRWFICQMFAP
ncbi:hypothetical protein ACP0HM_13680 [Escherichia coli]